MNSNHSYVLVTPFSDLWLGKNNASFPSGMFYDGIKAQDLESSKVIFIKTDKNGGIVQTVHEGVIKQVTSESNKIHFEYGDLEPISSQDYTKFTKSGCHLNKNKLNQVQEKSEYQKMCDILLQLTNNEEFESKVHKLMYQFHVDLRTIPRKEQAGKSDGFFKINRLHVLYDVTLQDNFETFKETQINNFVSQMNKGYIYFGKERLSLNAESDKQVWIITKNCDKYLYTEDGIKVRAVSVKYLCDLLQRFNNKFSSNEEQSKLLSALQIIDA
ncbi:MAG: hypothetical protein SFU27_07840 [Thermonemataceae bacterium]|nr:hypothetical protein [Thermonemataceae bacterium]